LLGGLVVALVAAVLYVTAANTVTTRKSELAQVSAGVAGWTAAANSYASFVQAAKRQSQELTDVRQLASARFPWSDLLGQIGGLMPRAAALSSLQATTTGAAGGSATSSASLPGVQLTGCAASQSVVAQTMVQLRHVSGVSDVTLSASTDSSSGAAASGSTSQGSSGGCPFPVQFQLSLTIGSSPTTATAASGGTSTTSTPATSATTAAPVAAQ
jgi:Tfp pilus assembly protein PilN